jgi:cytochrome c oxidase subunit 4
MSDHGHPAHGPITRPGETADETLEHAHDDHEHGHGGVFQYMLVFAALCFLTTMSFFTYSEYWPWKDQPQVGWTFMMAVSCTKALLVILFFMHVLWEANWKYVLTIPAAMMAVFMAIMLIPDIGFRNRMVSQERAVYMARPSDLELLERAGAEAQAHGAAAH